MVLFIVDEALSTGASLSYPMTSSSNDSFIAAALAEIARLSILNSGSRPV